MISTAFSKSLPNHKLNKKSISYPTEESQKSIFDTDLFSDSNLTAYNPIDDSAALSEFSESTDSYILFLISHSYKGVNHTFSPKSNYPWLASQDIAIDEYIFDATQIKNTQSSYTTKLIETFGISPTNYPSLGCDLTIDLGNVSAFNFVNVGLNCSSNHSISFEAQIQGQSTPYKNNKIAFWAILTSIIALAVYNMYIFNRIYDIYEDYEEEFSVNLTYILSCTDGLTFKTGVYGFATVYHQASTLITIIFLIIFIAYIKYQCKILKFPGFIFFGAAIVPIQLIFGDDTFSYIVIAITFIHMIQIWLYKQRLQRYFKKLLWSLTFQNVLKMLLLLTLPFTYRINFTIIFVACGGALGLALVTNGLSCFSRRQRISSTSCCCCFNSSRNNNSNIDAYRNIPWIRDDERSICYGCLSWIDRCMAKRDEKKKKKVQDERNQLKKENEKLKKQQKEAEKYEQIINNLNQKLSQDRQTHERERAELRQNQNQQSEEIARLREQNQGNNEQQQQQQQSQQFNFAPPMDFAPGQNANPDEIIAMRNVQDVDVEIEGDDNNINNRQR